MATLIALGLTLSSAVVAVAAGAGASPRLSGPGWRALVSLHGLSRPSAVQCGSLAPASQDAQAHAIGDLCLDEVGAVEWIARTEGGCATAAAETHCAADLLGADRYLSSSAAWAGWLGHQLGAGSCRSFFSGMARAVAELATRGDHFAVGMRRHQSASELQAASRLWLQAGRAWNARFYSPQGNVDLVGACAPTA